MNRDLRKQIIDFLKPYMDESTRRTLVEGALHGCDVIGKIGYWERDTDSFTNRLVTTLDSYGQCEGDLEPSLVVLIRHVGDAHGVDVRARAEALCSELLYKDGDKSSDDDPIADSLREYCKKLIERLEDIHWGLTSYIQERAKFLPIHASPYDKGVKHGESENLLKRLWHSKRTIVLGEPGMGKSVALERLAWELASNDPLIVPILIHLREYDGLPLLEWIHFKLLESDEQPIRDALQQSRDTGRFLNDMPFQFYLLLDGLNEVRPEHRTMVLGEIRRLAMAYPQHALVVTSRVQDESWRELRGGSFGHDIVVVQPITESQSQIYLEAHLEQYEAQDLWQRLDDRMRELASTPLLLWLIKEAWLGTKGDIPGNRGALYANFIKRMLRRDDDRKLTKKIKPYKRINALKKLALAMHKRQVISIKIDEVDALINDDELLESLRVNGLLQGEEVIRFAPHQTVQEHFVALAIQESIENQIKGISRETNIDISETANDAWWAETYIQLAGLTKDPNQLAQQVAEYNPWLAWWCVEEGQAVEPETIQAIEAQSIALVDSENVVDRRNAVQALIRLDHDRIYPQLVKLSIDVDSVAEPARQEIDAFGEQAKQDVANLFEERITRFEPPERAEIGRWLSDWGDMRQGVGVININGSNIPDIDWVTIPAGEFQYQDEEQPRHLEAFDIARYPITYAQFQCFVDVPNGLNSDNYDWFEGLHEDSKRYSLSDQRWKYNNHPRESVNWYQAMAFCRWLSFKLGGGYALDDIASWAVRLPTEYEWEKAVRGTGERTYPYGDEFDATKGNTKETGIGQTNTVGIFTDGTSPYGVLDLSGSVWEWCLSDYEDPAEHSTGENLSTSARRVLRGGSWNNYSSYARASYRGRNYPYFVFNYYGFRVCRSSSR